MDLNLEAVNLMCHRVDSSLVKGCAVGGGLKVIVGFGVYHLIKIVVGPVRSNLSRG